MILFFEIDFFIVVLFFEIDFLLELIIFLNNIN